MIESESNKSSNKSIFVLGIVKKCLPSIILNFLKRFISDKFLLTYFNKDFYVNYLSWEQAEQMSEGYDSDNIIKKIKKAAKLVFNGEAVYERDAVIFDKIEYSYPLLASLLFVAANSKSFKVIDFGGGLGTTYQQNRKFISKIKNVCEWRIVEQEKIVAIGKNEFTNKILSFYKTIEEANKDGVDVVIFSGCVNYVKNSYSFMAEAKMIKAPYIIFDRTQITNQMKDTFAVHNISSYSLGSSLPVRNFNYNNIVKFFVDEYELIEEWISDLQPDPNTTAMGLFFKRKSDEIINKL
jgi:putative methyltransferase (TIGR04325 family)